MVSYITLKKKKSFNLQPILYNLGLSKKCIQQGTNGFNTFWALYFDCYYVKSFSFRTTTYYYYCPLYVHEYNTRQYVNINKSIYNYFS